MFAYSINGVTVAVIRDVRKKAINATCSIRIRVTYKRKQVYYSTGIALNHSDWEKLLVSKVSKLVKIRQEVGMLYDIIKNHVTILVTTELFSFDNLNKRLGNATCDNVNTAFMAKINTNLSNEKIGTASNYKSALRSISLFAGNNIQFEQINVEWLTRYEKRLLVENKSYTTVSMYIRSLRAIINAAKATGIVKEINYPFGKGKYEIPNHIGRKMALSLPQIHKIVLYECPTKTIEMCRDIFFFSYLCNGANIKDLLKLKFANISNGEISFYRTKTISKSRVKKQINAIVTPEMQSIMRKWGNDPTGNDNYIFPFLSGSVTAIDEHRITQNVIHLINDNLKKIAKELNLPHISTYTARHSFATVLKRSGANISFISESLGHTDVKTTENYLDQFENEERMKNARALTNF